MSAPILRRSNLPDGFESTTSWERAKREETTINALGRVRWMVQVGDGSMHRLTFASDDGRPVGRCDCAGHQHRDWCAHIAAMWQAYVSQEIELADVSEPVDEELARLWRQYRRSEVQL